MLGLLKGLLNSSIEKTPPKSEQQKLIQGGEQMKFRGITIHKRKDCNTWYARHRINGKSVYISSKTQQDCYNKLKLIIKKEEQKQLKALKEPKPREQKSMNFIDWYKKWLELYKQNVKDTTKMDYNSSMKYLTKLNYLALNQISSMQIMEIINAIPFERRRQKAYEFLKDIFTKAKLNKIILENPLEIIDKPKHTKINGLAFSNQDESTLIKLLKSNNLDMFLICLYQGLGRGEVLALTRKDIDLNKKTISINKSLNNKGQFDTTKNIYRNRIVPIFNNTMEILKKYDNLLENERLFKISYGASDKLYHKLIKQNFPSKKYTIHSLRHTFVTKCQEANIPLHIIQSWVGHNIGSKVTNAVYTHTREVAMLENANKMNNYTNNL